MNFLVTLAINYIKSKATTELVKTLAISLLRALSARTDAKTDDSLVNLLVAVENGSQDTIERSVADLVDSVGVDLKRVAEKSKKTVAITDK